MDMIPNRPNSKLKRDKLPLAGRGFNRGYPANSSQPELVLDPTENYFREDGSRSAFSDTFTYTGASNKTVLDADGNLKWAPHNLLTYSEQFDNAAWVKISGGTGASPIVTANSGIAPDGTLSADKIVFSKGAGTTLSDLSATNSSSVTTTVGVSYTISVWMKAESGTANIALRFSNSGTFEVKEVVANSWQLFTLEASVTSAIENLQIILRGTYGTDEDVTVLVWGAHLYRSDLGGMQAVPTDERGLASSSTYLPTTSAARYLPRRNAYTYVNGTLTGPKLQIESAGATNLVTYSEDFTDASWVEAGNLAAMSAPSSLGPDGETSATLFVDDGSGGTSSPQIINAQNVTSATDHTLSVFLKKNGLDYGVLRSNNFDASGNGITYFNLDTGEITSQSANHSNATIENYGNGWYRCSITFQSTTDLAGSLVIQISANGANTTVDLDGTSSILIFGAMFEAGSVPSSYIPTSGSTAARAAETLTVTNPPWPATVEATGTELVTNGTFDADTDWTKGTGWTISGGVATHASGTLSSLTQTLSGITSGKIYQITLTVSGRTAGSVEVFFTGSSASGTITANGTFTYLAVDTGSNDNLGFQGNSTFDGSIDNVSVKEISPRGLAIAFDGLVTYADTGAVYEVFPIRWHLDSSNYIYQRVNTNGAATGQPGFLQAQAGVNDVINGVISDYSPGINVPVKIASRHGDNFVNGAVDGVALTEDTTPTILPDLSSTTLQICPTFNGYINSLRVWDVDIGDTGIEEASS